MSTELRSDPSEPREPFARALALASMLLGAGTLAAAVALALLAGGCAAEAPPAPSSPPAPRVVALDPPQQARDVDPARESLRVTFDREMDPEGWSWVIENAETAPALGEARFDADGRTNTVAVRLEPGRTYVVWVNSAEYAYFRDRAGAPAQPLRWVFTTRGGAAPATPPASAASDLPAASRLPLVPAHGAPQVVSLWPANGATDVDPGTRVLRARFDRPMEGSWSWVSEGASFPQTTGQAYFEADRRTAALPVKLEPSRGYVVWLNSAEFRLFRDTQGLQAPPLRWTFTTRAAD